MKDFRNLTFEIFATLLFVSLWMSPVFASGGFQSEADAEHAGYQGIPMRDNSNRGAVQQDGTDTQRYPTLPRRQNETSFGADIVSGPENSNQNDRDGGGYRGIPRSSSNQSDAPRNDDASPHRFDRAGYSGIPQSIASNPDETQIAARQNSPLISPK